VSSILLTIGPKRARVFWVARPFLENDSDTAVGFFVWRGALSDLFL